MILLIEKKKLRFFFFFFWSTLFFFFFFATDTQEEKKSPKAPHYIRTALCYVPLSFSLLEKKRDDGQHRRDRDDGPPTSSRATVRFCSLSLSAFFSLLLLYFFIMCARMFPPHVAFREEEVTFHSLSFSSDGSIDLDFKSIPKPCEN